MKRIYQYILLAMAIIFMLACTITTPLPPSVNTDAQIITECCRRASQTPTAPDVTVMPSSGKMQRWEP